MKKEVNELFSSFVLYLVSVLSRAEGSIHLSFFPKLDFHDIHLSPA